jgi:uncharacterized protein
MNIEHRPQEDLGSFFAMEGDKEAGELAYRMIEGNILTLDHTDVEPEFKDKGIGRQLVQAAVDHARKHGYKLRPLCTYAQLLFERNKEWQELRV